MRKMTHWYPPRHEAPSLRVDDRHRRAARLPLYSHAFGLSRLIIIKASELGIRGIAIGGGEHGH